MLVATLIRATSKVRLIVRAISCRKKKKKKVMERMEMEDFLFQFQKFFMAMQRSW